MADSGEWRKIVNYAATLGVPYRVVSTYRPGAHTATGNISRHSMGLAVDFAGPTASRDSDQLLKINLAFEPVAHLLHELIYSGPGSYQVYNGAPHHYSGVTRDNHHDHVHVSIDYGAVFPSTEDFDMATGDQIQAHLSEVKDFLETRLSEQHNTVLKYIEDVMRRCDAMKAELDEIKAQG